MQLPGRIECPQKKKERESIITRAAYYSTLKDDGRIFGYIHLPHSSHHPRVGERAKIRILSWEVGPQEHLILEVPETVKFV